LIHTSAGQRRPSKHLAGINPMRLSVQELLVGVIGLSGLAELDHGNLEIVQRTLHETVVLFVMHKKVVPQGMLETDRRVSGTVNESRLMIENGTLPCSGPLDCPG